MKIKFKWSETVTYESTMELEPEEIQARIDYLQAAGIDESEADEEFIIDYLNSDADAWIGVVDTKDDFTGVTERSVSEVQFLSPWSAA